MNETLKKFSIDLVKDFKEALAKQHSAELVAKIQAADEAAGGTFKVVVSTSDEDRQGDALDQSKWNLENYKANPVVLWAHDYYEPPIGICTNIYVEGDQLIAEGKFASAELNPFGAQIAGLYEAGFVKATSVGFIIHEDGALELLEFSFCPVPANPYALSMRQVKELRLDLPQLVMKGLRFQVKAEKPGDTCELEDGTPGVLAEDSENPGELRCVPNHSKSMETLVDALKGEHARHAQAVAKSIEEFKSIDEFKTALGTENDTHLENCVKAIDENYALEDQKKGIDEFKTAFNNEHQEHVKCFDKAIEEFKDIDEFEKTAGPELQRHEKAQMDLCKAEMGEGETDEEKALIAAIKVFDIHMVEIGNTGIKGYSIPSLDEFSKLMKIALKAGRQISAKNKEKIATIIKAIEEFKATSAEAHDKHSNNVIAALKDLTGPDAGNEGEEPKDDKKSPEAPKPKVEVRDIPSPVDDFESLMFGRKVLRKVDSEIGIALEQFNKRFKEHFADRR